MIPRYSRPEMSRIWEQENRYRLWLEIEMCVCDAQAFLGYIPQSIADDIRTKARFNRHRIAEIEDETRHDVVAFLTNVAENVGENGRFLHQGLTSSDVVDTAFAIQLTQAADLLLEGISKLCQCLKERAFEYQDTLCIGRTHGIHAEPTSFGLKLARHYAVFKRNQARLRMARKEVATCMMSGTVGTFATLDPKVELYVARRFGLSCETISTQVIPRDRHAVFFAILGVLAASIESLAVELRHLQRSEVGEVAEPFATTQKGSSAMPHKRNPVVCENLTGLARLVRSMVSPMLENVTLWHERDISHSSVERVLAPDVCIVLDFALVRLQSLIEGLEVYPQRMKENLDQLYGVIFSHRILLELTKAGMKREQAYKIVQSHAMHVSTHRSQYLDRLLQDPEVMRLLERKTLVSLFDTSFYLRYVKTIFQRVFDDDVHPIPSSKVETS